MIPVYITNDNIVIRNIERHELEQALICINETKDNVIQLGRYTYLDYDEINQRYLETLMNSLEFFCGIFINNSLIGIIKGRIENNNKDELIILSYLLFEKFRNKGIGSKLLNIFENYFTQNFSINKYLILLIDKNNEGKNFWFKNGYIFSRNIKASSEELYSHMIILEKEIDY